MGGMEEVELGRVAVKNGQSDKVKEFGQRMIDDHSKAGDDLKSVAAKKQYHPAGSTRREAQSGSGSL